MKLTDGSEGAMLRSGPVAPPTATIIPLLLRGLCHEPCQPHSTSR